MNSPQPASDLSGKVALVTGAGSGIGRSTCLRLHEAGAAVMCADINADGAKTTEQSILDDGGQAASLRLDVTDEGAVEKSLQQTLDALGGFDVLFNNAGIGDVDYGRTLEVNLNGVYYGLRYGAELLAQRGGGSIINTASIAGLQGLVTPLPMGPGIVEGGGVAYIASKHAVVGMTRQYAIAYGERGVRVNAVAPGYIETPMTEMIQDGSVIQEGYESLHPMGRLGQPDEIANAVVFLASDRSSFITGVTLPVDGGYSAR
jgi:NAD(P)-dependent dehydrogenase (short-subunit alcohol dehydrogenase family)